MLLGEHLGPPRLGLGQRGGVQGPPRCRRRDALGLSRNAVDGRQEASGRTRGAAPSRRYMSGASSAADTHGVGKGDRTNPRARHCCSWVFPYAKAVIALCSACLFFSRFALADSLLRIPANIKVNSDALGHFPASYICLRAQYPLHTQLFVVCVKGGWKKTKS